MTELMTQMMSMSAWEAIATLLSLVYVILAAKGNMWCWPAAFVSTLIMTVIFYDVFLFMDSLLHAYYLLMAVYGYWQWRKNSRCNATEMANKTTDSRAIIGIQRWHVNRHVGIILGLSAVSWGVGFYMAHYTQADFPYLDSLTTVFAIFTTYLVTIKVLENWLYWIVIDAVSIYLYLNKSLYFFAALMMIYTVIAVWGYMKWRADMESTASLKAQNI